MNEVLKSMLKALGSKLLLSTIECVAEELKERNDNSMVKDADRIIELTQRNTAES
ncbi:hypothetical protein [Vibrio sp. SCSIO 43136]|uniref:hypothetical protein n=1 Tax=Vibrio sp. SCSIO 43136 TaxID=2819101 RepID=UPI002075B995|nr:hypothetical protein [Vibrio sp. SCSIO 43136]USD68122.1 hypothetical protein J4N39_18280 [Vibrio sp. SCSIO 43136]